MATGAALQGCADESSSRALWLAQTLTADNLVFARREPDLVAGKYRKMALGAHDFLRGSLGVWRRDQAEAGPGTVPTAFASGPSSLVAALGDPHLENLGAFAPGLQRDASGGLTPNGAISLEWNDFDAAGYAPFHLDVRRLALGFAVLALEVERRGVLGLGAGDADGLATAVAEGYAAEVLAALAGAAPLVVAVATPLSEDDEAALRDSSGVVVADLLRRAAEDGAAAATFAEAVVWLPEPETFALQTGVLEPPRFVGIVEREVLPLDEEERARVGRWLRAASPSQPPLLLDATRRLGAGVGSYALLRYDALVHLPQSVDPGPYLLELKEIADAPPMPLPTPNPRPFADNAARAATLQRVMQSDAGRDRFLAAAQDGGVAVKIRHRTAWQKGLSVDRVVEKMAAGKWTAQDVFALARLAGRLLAAAHLRAPRADGGAALSAIAPLLHDRQDAFAAETARATEAALPILHRDARLLGALLQTEGPLLGLDPAADGASP